MWSSLFTQYEKRGRSLLFASKWMNWHGRTFIGNPADMDMGEVSPELLKSYYYVTADRWAPTTKDMDKEGEDQARMKYRQDNLRLSMLRNNERRTIAKAASLGVLVCVVALFSANAVLIKGTGAVASVFKGGSSSNSNAVLAENECVDLIVDLYKSKQIQTRTVPADQEKQLEQCQKDHPKSVDTATTQLREEGAL